MKTRWCSAVGFLLILLMVTAAGVSCSGRPAVSAAPSASNGSAIQNLSVPDAYALVQKNQGNSDFVILDVRTSAEFQQGHLAGAINIDFYSQDFQARTGQLDKNRQYLVYCRSGSRSAQASQIMVSQGFSHISNMLQGISEWIAAGYPVTEP